MTQTALPPQGISTAVFRAWTEGLTEPVPTVFPGLRHDTSRWSEWCELWVDHWSPRNQRHHAPEFADLRITVHVFVRGSRDKGRIQELIERARAILNGKTLPITTLSESSAAPSGEIVGYIKLGVADVKELSRLDADAQRHGLQHHVAIWNGIAQRVLSSP